MTTNQITIKKREPLRHVHGDSTVHTLVVYEYRGYRIEGRVLSGSANSSAFNRKTRAWNIVAPDGTSRPIRRRNDARDRIDALLSTPSTLDVTRRDYINKSIKEAGYTPVVTTSKEFEAVKNIAFDDGLDVSVRVRASARTGEVSFSGASQLSANDARILGYALVQGSAMASNWNDVFRGWKSAEQYVAKENAKASL